MDQGGVVQSVLLLFGAEGTGVVDALLIGRDIAARYMWQTARGLGHGHYKSQVDWLCYNHNKVSCGRRWRPFDTKRNILWSVRLTDSIDGYWQHPQSRTRNAFTVKPINIAHTLVKNWIHPTRVDMSRLAKIDWQVWNSLGVQLRYRDNMNWQLKSRDERTLEWVRQQGLKQV
jgi:hypothetical protein